MNIVDIVLALLLLYGLVTGFFNGFFAELASLVAFIAGIYGAIYFSYIVNDFLAERVSWNIQFVQLISFAITFILIVFVISLLGKLLTTAANFAALGIVNKILGAVFGFVKVAFITSVIIMFFNTTNEKFTLVNEETLETSVLYGPIKVLAPAIVPAILREINELEFLEDDLKEEMEEEGVN